MSTTLTNGLKLPDKGSVDWYADMQNNYTILDGAVGTVAEHTSALAGKAPLSHTHTKSDVTDLLNSNFIPSANNTYDLGSSSNQWNNIYAKNYYYNGTPWGLDKANTWSQNQIIASGISDRCYYVKDTVYELGQTYSNGEHLGGLTIHDKNDSTVGLLDIVDRSYGNTEMRIRVQQKFDPDSNNRSTSGTILFNELIIGIAPNKTNYLGFNADLWGANYNLGTPTQKWKTLNGINPGALSLPSGAAENINTDNWNFSWSANTVTAPFDGYISVACFGSALQINNETKSYAMTYAPGSDGFICGLLPVSSGDSIKVLVTRTQTSIYEGYKFIKANGNVS